MTIPGMNDLLKSIQKLEDVGKAHLEQKHELMKERAFESSLTWSDEIERELERLVESAKGSLDK